MTAATNTLRRAFPPSAVAAGLISVLVAVTSTGAIVFSAATAAGASPAEVTSWMLAVCVGMGVTSIALSLRYRAPIVTAWSTTGAALLAASLHGVSMAQAIGAFVVSAALITLTGLTGWFERLMDRIPVPLASGLLAGVLVHFGIDLFGELETSLVVVGPMVLAYLLARRWLARYAVLVALAVGVVATAATGTLRLDRVDLALATPVFTMPEFDWQVIISVALPLYIVTMASQNLPGVAVLRGDGYTEVPLSPVIGTTGVANLLLAPFGCFGLNLAAITAAICTGPQALEDRNRRYIAAVWAGLFYLVVAVFAGTVGSLLAAMPEALIIGISGLGLLATISGSLGAALADDRWRESALVTFLATASGVTLLGIGSAFWGLLAGVLTAAITLRRRPEK
ncbi:hypothetical protein BJF85_12745 [Saccharomonospora sp. CUA-673]|uniref:benzoate/H(+) symporter BenE family transporter n=1 Tax=Saccharomonospora sp. CUA-673 TaxID=1904969 RepID=UPI0009645DD2|nr:benzoate/H(+) symporter BenE family transporter [Saccharomonospora sp. CUA-673]OLT48386.1 hypothetical protein BJF85_12745 [Saccharomonospora sp. CUA-673]